MMIIYESNKEKLKELLLELIKIIYIVLIIMSQNKSNIKKIIEIKSTEEFLKTLEAHKNEIIVLDFFADWCGPCKRLGEVLHSAIEVEGKYPNVIFLKVNVDNEECTKLADKFQVSSIPRVIIFKGKTVKGDILGTNVSEIFNLIDELEKKKVEIASN